MYQSLFLVEYLNMKYVGVFFWSLGTIHMFCIRSIWRLKIINLFDIGPKNLLKSKNTASSSAKTCLFSDWMLKHMQPMQNKSRTTMQQCFSIKETMKCSNVFFIFIKLKWNTVENLIFCNFSLIPMWKKISALWWNFLYAISISFYFLIIFNVYFEIIMCDTLKISLI